MDIKHYLEIAKEETKAAFSNNKWLLLFSTLLFVIPLLFGYFYADSISDYIQPMVDNFQKQVDEGVILGALGGVLGALILANNGMFIGYFGADFNIYAYLALTLPHGIFEIPAIIIATTGGFVLLSFVLHFIWNLRSPDYSYLDIFDPYFSDVKITFKQRCYASFKMNQNKIKESFIKESFIFLCLAVILLIIAAFIEANITVPLAGKLLPFFGLSMG